MDQKIGPLLQEDVTRLAEQYLRVEVLAMDHLGRKMPGDDGNLDVVQELLDRRVFSPEATYDLQCLGIVLGMRLCHAVEGLDWAIVEDEYGRDPALRYLDTSILVFVLTIISKRVEDGTDVDVRDMFEQIPLRIAEMKERAPNVH
jgi:hypothetical protein